MGAGLVAMGLSLAKETRWPQRHNVSFRGCLLSPVCYPCSQPSPRQQKDCIKPGMRREVSPGGRRNGFLEGRGVMSREGRDGERMEICIPQVCVPIAPQEPAPLPAPDPAVGDTPQHFISLLMSSPLSIMPGTSSATSTAPTSTGNINQLIPSLWASKILRCPHGREALSPLPAGEGGFVAAGNQPHLRCLARSLEKSGRRSLPPPESTEICQIAPAGLMLLSYLSLQGLLVCLSAVMNFYCFLGM